MKNSGAHYYNVEDGHRLKRNPLKAIVAPRPIGWISTVSNDGVANLSPYSFFNMINDVPPMLMFSSTGYKDSVSNIAQNGEFVVNIVSRELSDGMNISSKGFSSCIDEFIEAGIEKASCHRVAPYRVAASPASLECKLVEICQLKDMAKKPLDSWMVIGQIVGVHIKQSCIQDGLFRTELAGPILRGGYASEYWSIGEEGLFHMKRPI